MPFAQVLYKSHNFLFNMQTVLLLCASPSLLFLTTIVSSMRLTSKAMGLIDAVLINIWNVCDGIDIIGSRLRWKKVLLIIDDVSDVEQLQSLAGKRDWFGPGSRILITTRDKQLLVAHEVDEEHILNLDVLNNDEAIQLLSMKAFKTHQPVQEYVELSEHVLEYAGGLPLALKVLGSFLIGRSADLWRSTIWRVW
ncbi:hypothetical protein KPL71_008743 [Citrus sinensis]|uniref:Uncharacterized protein n=1 Tax=Citrus sinensis TaxID=2711 RepID=A0ACB8M8U5_CITSI|nr:hypothetical protein KPL71_008743 [Citrus sinensis]